jgi:hypothetical protein
MMPNYGEFTLSRAALVLTLPGASPDQLADSQGKYRSTFPNAPTGDLTVRFDIAGKLRSDPARYHELATALSGPSQGPSYALLPIPDEPDRAIGVCEYGYYYSKLDFSQRATQRRVLKQYLPSLSSGVKSGLPVRAGVGPYNAAWFHHDDALWLYATGYTGITRMKYATAGRCEEAFTVETVHPRLQPHPIDGRPRGSVKDFLHLLPAPDGRLIDVTRGRPGRGGGPFSAGLELFDPRSLGASQTAVHLSRCFGLYTPVHRLVLSTAGAPMRQELFVASGPIRPEYVADLPDPALAPAHSDPKIFRFDCPSGGDLADRYGFSVPIPAGASDASCYVAFSQLGQYLVLVQVTGHGYVYCPAEQRFVDAIRLIDGMGQPLVPISFDRPSSHILTAPSGAIFLATATGSPGVTFVELAVSPSGQLTPRSHLTINDATREDIEGVVRCFLPDLIRQDGSYDFVLGGAQERGGPQVRVIEDFIPPRIKGGRPL